MDMYPSVQPTAKPKTGSSMPFINMYPSFLSATKPIGLSDKHPTNWSAHFHNGHLLTAPDLSHQHHFPSRTNVYTWQSDMKHQLHPQLSLSLGDGTKSPSLEFLLLILYVQKTLNCIWTRYCLASVETHWGKWYMWYKQWGEGGRGGGRGGGGGVKGCNTVWYYSADHQLCDLEVGYNLNTMTGKPSCLLNVWAPNTL